MQDDARRALITYALVSEELDKTNDFFLGLTPLFTIIAAENAGKSFDAETFSADLGRLFGLRIHSSISEYLVARLAASRLLVRVQNNEEPQYLWRSPDSASLSPTIEKDIDLVIERFSSFLETNSPLVKRSLSQAETENLLLDAIIHHDHSIRSAEDAILGETPLVTVTKKGRPRHSNEFDYYFSHFLQHLKKQRDTLLDKISGIANAAIVSEAILELATPSLSQRPTRVNLTVFLDGPFVMDFIGLSGPDRQSYTKFIVDSLRGLGCQLLVFRHYVLELQNILKALFARPAYLRRGPTADALINRKLTEEYAKAVMHNPEQFVTNSGLIIFDPATHIAPANQRNIFMEDEDQQLTQLLISRYERLEALERDISSVRHIMNRRRNFNSDDFFQARFILVTHNEYLAQTVNSYASHHYSIPRSRFGPVIHQQKLYAILWLVIGGHERKELSRVQLIRNCARALEYNPAIVQRIREKLESIDHDKAKQFEVLISQPRYIQLAFDLGHAAGTIDEVRATNILENLKEDLISEERAKARELVTKEKGKRREAEKALSESLTQSTDLQNDLAQHIRVVRTLIELEVRNQRRKYRAIWSGVRVTLFVAGVIVALATFYSDRVMASEDSKLIWSCVKLLLAIVSIYCSVFEYGLNWIKRKIEDWFQSDLEDKIIYELKINDVVGAIEVNLFDEQISWPSHLEMASHSKDSKPELRQHAMNFLHHDPHDRI